MRHPKQKIQIINREHWLNEAVQLFQPKFREAGLLTPPVHISIGFPTRRALAAKNRTIGQCFTGSLSDDLRAHIFISPVIRDSLEVLATVYHEYLHASVGTECGHKGAFREMYKNIGLTGKPTHTIATPELKQWFVEHVIVVLGKYPHFALTPLSFLKRKGESCRQLKAQCPDPDCGYTIRITRKWIEFGMPTCPCGEVFVEA